MVLHNIIIVIYFIPPVFIVPVRKKYVFLRKICLDYINIEVKYLLRNARPQGKQIHN